MPAHKATEVRPSLPDIRFKALPAPATGYRRPAPGMSAEIADRIRREFFEMRGFSPTVEQAARLFQINREECGRILRALVDEGFLKQTPDGRFRLPPQPY